MKVNAPTMITTPISKITNKGVWVDTHVSSGANSDRAFHVIALLD